MKFSDRLKRTIKQNSLKKLQDQIPAFEKYLKRILLIWNSRIFAYLSNKSGSGYSVVDLGYGIKTIFPNTRSGNLRNSIITPRLVTTKTSYGFESKVTYGYDFYRLKSVGSYNSYAEYLAETSLIRWKKSDYIQRSLESGRRLIIDKTKLEVRKVLNGS